MNGPDSIAEPILILAPVGRDAGVIRGILAEAGLVGTVCDSVGELVERLASAGTAVLTEEGLRTDLRPLATWVAHQPPWSDFPFLLLTQRTAAPNPQQRYGEILGNVMLLERPLHGVTLVSAVHAALRARRRQREAEAYLGERERTQEALRRLAATLEQRVEERTRELAEANRQLVGEIEERRRAEQALLQAQKMEAVGQLTGGVAHDFNNLLAAVLGNIELALRRTTDENLLRVLRNAMRAAQRGGKLTEQLLAFSRKQHLKPEPADVNRLVSGMGDLLLRTMGGLIRIETVLDRNLWPALVDPTQLELAILNLAINARDAMPRGGRLRIETDCLEVGSGDDLHRDLEPGRYVKIVVSDTGEGMSDEARSKAFEPFFTTKQPGKGSGLGLSQVYGFVRQSSGTVRLHSRPAEGTSVEILLPSAEAAAAAGASEEVGFVQAASRARILVVDDDADVRELAVSLLQELGYEVMAAATGSEALEVLNRGGYLDLLLADLAMPGMNGLELAREARTRRPGLGVVFATGYADTAVFGEVVEQEFILKKPYRLNELAAAIEEGLRARPAPTPASNVVALPSTRR